MRRSHTAGPAAARAPGTVLGGEGEDDRHRSARRRLRLAEGSLQRNDVHVLRRAMGHGEGKGELGRPGGLILAWGFER